MGTRIGIMLCHPLEEKRLQRWNTPYVVCQPKLDGERCRVLYFANQPFPELLSSEGNSFTSVPHILEALTRAHPGYSCEFDGELYNHDWDFSQIHSVCGRTKNLHPEHEKIQLHVFDTISADQQLIRIQRFQELCTKCDHNLIVPIDTILIENNIQQIADLMDSYFIDGYEGIILRHPNGIYERKRSNFIMKFKPGKEDIYPIAGYSCEIDKNGNLKPDILGRLCCFSEPNSGLPFLGEYPARVKLPDGYFGCGSGFDAAQRSYFWEKRETLVGMYCLVKYQQLTPKKVPRFPIFGELIDPIDYNYGNPITIEGNNT
jgi:DNA ligase-1